jgi:hypothetical protein
VARLPCGHKSVDPVADVLARLTRGSKDAEAPPLPPVPDAVKNRGEAAGTKGGQDGLPSQLVGLIKGTEIAADAAEQRHVASASAAAVDTAAGSGATSNGGASEVVAAHVELETVVRTGTSGDADSRRGSGGERGVSIFDAVRFD